MAVPKIDKAGKTGTNVSRPNILPARARSARLCSAYHGRSRRLCQIHRGLAARGTSGRACLLESLWQVPAETVLVAVPGRSARARQAARLACGARRTPRHPLPAIVAQYRLHAQGGGAARQRRRSVRLDRRRLGGVHGGGLKGRWPGEKGFRGVLPGSKSLCSHVVSSLSVVACTSLVTVRSVCGK